MQAKHSCTYKQWTSLKKNILVDSLGSLSHRIISSANNNTLTSSFPIYGLSIWLSSIALLVLSTLHWHDAASGHLHHIPDLSTNTFPILLLIFSSIILATFPADIGFIIFSYVSFILCFFRTFIMKGYRFLSKAFSVFIRMITWLCPWVHLCHGL